MTRAATAAEIADHNYDLRKHDPRPSDPIRQVLAVASLIGHCEALAASGHLTEPAEKSLRVLIAHTLAAFNMPSKAEREHVDA